MRRLARILLCRLGIHRWQYLMAPPTWRIRDSYEAGLWCIFCGAKHPARPGNPTSKGAP